MKSHIESNHGIFRGMEIFYSFDVSSQEFLAVVFVFSIPDHFETSSETRLTILSQIYQAITRAQIQLILIADANSIARLQKVLKAPDEFLGQRKNVRPR